MAITLTLDGTDRSSYLQEFSFRRGINRTSTGSLSLIDPTGTFIPAEFDSVLIQDGSTRLFYGYIVALDSVTWFANTTGTRIQCAIVGYNHCPQRQMFNTIYTSTTLKAILEDIVGVLDDDFPITLHASQVTGPTIDTLTLAWSYLDEVLDALATLTGYVWGIDENAVLRMWAIGDLTGGHTYSVANGNIRAFEWSKRIPESTYRNAQWIVYGPGEVLEKTVTLDGDGSTRDFTLPYAINQGSAPGYVYDSNAAANLPLGVHPDIAFKWCYDSATNQIREQTGYTTLTGTEYLTVNYQPGFPQAALADDNTERLASGVWLRKDDAPDIVEYDEAVDLADALIRKHKERPKTMTLVTLESYSSPGYLETVNVPELDVSAADVLVTEVAANYSVGEYEAGVVEYTLTLVGKGVGGTAHEYQDAWPDFWKSLSGSSGGSIIGSASSSMTASGLRVHLGGNRYEELTATSWAPIPNWQELIAPVAGNYTLRVQSKTTNAGTSVQIRLAYWTGSVWAVVGSALTAVTATDWTEAVELFTLTAGTRYRVEFLTNNDTYTVLVGQATMEL